jgi:hypothetical protein
LAWGVAVWRRRAPDKFTGGTHGRAIRLLLETEGGRPISERLVDAVPIQCSSEAMA